MARQTRKGTIIIAGPGAGKTHNMVARVISTLPSLSPGRYLAVITYTNSATNNILSRLSKQVAIPSNLFVGTIHSFFNRFFVAPFSSFMEEPVAREKLFMQCSLDDVFDHVEKKKTEDKKSKTYQEINYVKTKIRKRLNEMGYITFDQTMSIAKQCADNARFCRIIANRIQYLFVDEFQDSGNDVYGVIEAIRKVGKTEIYCVGDPEQYIQSFDSSIRNFTNIPILKAATSTGYNVEVNTCNYRSSKSIVTFLNQFNGRAFGTDVFEQIALEKLDSSPKQDDNGLVYYIPSNNVVKPAIETFNELCNSQGISVGNRTIIAKKKDVIRRIVAALNNVYRDPKKTTSALPIKIIQETLLTTLQMNTSKFCAEYNTTVNTLRKHAIAIFKAISSGVITDENSYGVFVTETLRLELKAGLPVKIDNLKFDVTNLDHVETVTVATIHTIKGLESEAVLAIAKNEAELLLWTEKDRVVRDTMRDNETTDYPRLGYVAFSRAERMLCISCLTPVSNDTLRKLEAVGICLYNKQS